MFSTDNNFCTEPTHLSTIYSTAENTPPPNTNTPLLLPQPRSPQHSSADEPPSLKTTLTSPSTIKQMNSSRPNLAAPMSPLCPKVPAPTSTSGPKSVANIRTFSDGFGRGPSTCALGRRRPLSETKMRAPPLCLLASALPSRRLVAAMSVASEG